MAKKSGRVYCYRLGTVDRFRVGQTKTSPDQRKKNWRSGADTKPQKHRIIETDNAPLLEGYIQNLLQEYRAENGDIFNVHTEKIDAAIDQAKAFLRQFQPLDVELEVKELRRMKPAATLAEPTPEISSLHRQLMEARSQKFLLQKQIDILEMRIKLAIGEHSGMNGVASWQWVSRWSIDLRRFEEEDPDAYRVLSERYKHDFGARKFVPEKGALRLESFAQTG